MSIATLVGGLGFVGAASADLIPGTGAGLTATNATALSVNNGGIGHALITPYFSAQNGNATLISVVNTDAVNGKVVKVRFRGASNSDDILDFTVLMSPGDVWNATVTAAAGAAAAITTYDRTCTIPQLAAGVAQSFVTSRLTSKGGNDVNNNTREGYVEIFNMADIKPGSALFTATKHVNGVPPCTSNAAGLAAINALVSPPITLEAAAGAAGMDTPTTGLFGDWAIINVPQTTTYSGQMVAVRAQVGVGGPDGRGNFVQFAQSASAYPGVVTAVTADPLLAGGFSTMSSLGVGAGAVAAPIAAAYYDFPDMSTPYIAAVTPLAQAGNLTAALAVKTIMNEYATDASISGKTDWVFSMPTRRYSVAMNYAPATSAPVFSSVIDPTTLNSFFYTGNVSVNTANSQQLCVTAASQVFYDREETTKTTGAVFSPGSISKTQFCGETSVLSFADTGNSALSAAVARQDTGSSAFTNGWGSVNVVDGTTGLGLPILGSSFLKATNPAAGAGFAGTYGLSFEHRFTR